MAAFLASTAHLLHPHLSIETVSAISPSAPLAPLPSTSDIPSATNVTHRMTVTVRPICIDWDLGLADRLNDITRAFTDTTAYLSLFLSDSQSDITSPHPTWDIMHDIANTQAHRHDIGHDREIQPPITTTRIVASRVQLKVSFPDSPSAPRPTVATIPSHDARGSLRPEQLLLELSDVDASTEMLADAQAAAMRDTEWLIRFGWGAAYLIMPVDATSQPLIKRVLTTTSNTSTATPFVKILSRSLLVTPFHPLQDPSLPPPSSHTQFSSRTQTLEDLFFQALPTFRWWEPGKSSTNNNTEPTTRLFTGGNDGHATHTAADKTLPNSAQFESTAVAQSSIVVTLGLPACAMDLTKTEYDLIMILYNIYSEMMDAVPTSTTAPSHSRRTSHTFPTQPQEIVEDGLTGPSRRTGIERAHGIDGDEEQHMAMSRSDSFSGSDSDSSSDMFESVVGADSVILRAPQDDDSDDDARTHHRHQQRRWKKQQQQHKKKQQQQPVHEEEEDDDSSSGGEEVDGPLTMDSADAKHDDEDDMRLHTTHMHVTHASSPPPYISPQQHPLASSETETISHRASDVDLANMDVHDVDLLQSNLFHPSLETSQQLSLSTSQLFTSHPNMTTSQLFTSHPHMTTSQLFTSHANNIGRADVPSTFFTQGSGSPSDAASASGSLSGSNLSGVGSGMGSGTFDHEHDLLSTSIAQLPPQHDMSDSGFFTQHNNNDEINRLPDAFHTFSLRTGAMSPHETPLSDTDSNADVDVTSDHEPAFATSSHDAVEEQPQEHDEAAHINTDDVFAHASYTSMVSQFLPPQQSQQQPPSSSMTASSDGDDNVAGMGVSQYQSFVAPRPDASVMATQIPDDDTSDTSASPTHATSQHTGSGSASAVYAQMASQPSHRDIHSPRKSTPSPHKHFLALQLTIQQGSFCLHEDDISIRAAQAAADVLAAASGMAARTPSPPQTYHCDVGEVYVFQVVQFEGKPVTYVSARAGDVTMREYTQVIPTTSQLMTQPSIPVLFKTMGEGDDTKPSELSRATSHLSTTPTDWFDSSAWRNPVLICNFVMKLNTSLNVRDTVAVINLRALTWQYRVESEWMIKLMNWFTPTPTVTPSMTTTTSTTEAAFPAIPVPTSPVINDVVKLYLHAYDCAVDYNPLTISPRAILSFDHIQLSTIIYPASPSSSFKLEFRDGSMFVLHRTAKIDFAPCHNRYQLDAPYLHRLSHDSLFAHLESHAFARVATLDYLEVDIHQHTPPSLPPGAIYEPTVPELAIEIRNGLLTVFTCWDSFQTVVELLTHVVDSVSEQLKMPEIDIVFPTQESHQHHDDEDDDNNDMEAGLGKVPSVRFADDTSTSPQPSRDLLADLDPDMFGADLGSANQYGASSMSHHLIDNYHDEKSRQTSISLALQAAAEREIARALREREMATFNANYGEDYGGPHVPFSYHQQHQPQHRIRDDANIEHMARWFSQRERDAINDDQKVTTSEDAPHDYRAHFVRELRDFERRAARGGRSNRPVPPQVIDNHVSMPDKDDYQSDETTYLHPPKHFPKPITQVVFLDWNVVWRLFGGSDWVEEDVDVKQDENGDEKHQESKQNTPPDIPRQSSRDEHIQQHTWYDGVDPMILHQHSSFTNMDGQMGGVGIDLDEKYGHVTSTPTATSIPPRKESDAAMQTVHIPTTSIPVRDLNTYMDTAGQHDPFLPTYATPPSQPPSFSSASTSTSPSTPVRKGTRLTDSVIEFHFDGATIRLDTYARAEQIASRTAIAINQFEIHDCLATSSFKKMLCYYRTQPHGRALHSSMFRFDLVSVRPDVKRHTEEYRVECTILPLRLNIDQDALEFLISFFTHDPLTTSAKRDAELAKKQQQVDRAFASTDKATSFPSHPAYLDQGDHKHMETNHTTSTSTVATPSYIQHFVVRALRICVDYRPKRVNYRGLQDGDYAQLVHLFPLEQVEIDLKRVTLTGIQGWDRVFLQLVTVWGQDVARTQAHRYLAGVQPIRSVVNVGAGVADLLLMPIQQYQKNGRLARGVQQGTMSFAKSVAMEGMNVATRIAQGAQTLLETMDEVVSSHPTDRPTAPTRSRRKRVIQSKPRSRDPAATHHTRYDKMADQPSGYREGFRQAYESLARALQTAAHGIVVVPQEDYVRYGTREAVKSAIRAVPSAILRPMIGASEALSKALLGAQNTLDPDRAKESQDKYKTSRNTSTS